MSIIWSFSRHHKYWNWQVCVCDNFRFDLGFISTTCVPSLCWTTWHEFPRHLKHHYPSNLKTVVDGSLSYLKFDPYARGIPSQRRPVMRIIYDFVIISRSSLDKRSFCWSFETKWRSYDVAVISNILIWLYSVHYRGSYHGVSCNMALMFIDPAARLIS